MMLPAAVSHRAAAADSTPYSPSMLTTRPAMPASSRIRRHHATRASSIR
jgi:hypothetical protein